MQHFKALILKNWILWKRTCCCSFFELALPIIFSFFLLVIRALVDSEIHLEKFNNKKIILLGHI